MVRGAIVVADDRPRADGIADKSGQKHKVYVHEYAVCGNAVFACVFYKLYIIQHTHDRHGDIGHKLRGTVCTCLPQGSFIHKSLAKPQRAVVFTCKIKKRCDAADKLAAYSSRCRSDDAAGNYCDKQRIQDDICHSGSDRDRKPHLRLFCGSKKALELVLQHQRRQRKQAHSAVNHALCKHFAFCSKCGCDWTDKKHPKGCNDKTAGSRDIDKQGKHAVCLFRPAFTHCLCDQGAAARAKHKADSAKDH